ncbi:hypothetical protein GGR53DRAFT_463349 [Hypoxylon sp. FL1150]|nr:hypothetical protein GGR53DRAFT_463349 [Hypoxylon sp. FL1150]
MTPLLTDSLAPQFLCEVPGCDESRTTKHSVDHHMMNAHVGTLCLIPSCGVAYNTAQELKDHLKEAHKPKQVKKGRGRRKGGYECHWCGTTFEVYSSATRCLVMHHGRIHLGIERPIDWTGAGEGLLPSEESEAAEGQREPVYPSHDGRASTPGRNYQKEKEQLKAMMYISDIRHWKLVREVAHSAHPTEAQHEQIKKSTRHLATIQKNLDHVKRRLEDELQEDEPQEDEPQEEIVVKTSIEYGAKRTFL